MVDSGAKLAPGGVDAPEVGIARQAMESDFYRSKFAAAGLVPDRLASTAWDQLPFTTKQELLADQTVQPPYGSNLTFPLHRYTRLHQTSGSRGQPLRWLDTPEGWGWLLGLWEKIYGVVGVRTGDRFFFPFSFGPFLGFWAAFEGATRLGYFSLAGGGLSTVARLRLLLDHAITIVGCTPTYALRLAEVAEEEGMDLKASAVRLLILAGEPGASISAVRQRLEQAFAARVIDHWGMTEVGSLGIECLDSPGGFHLLGEDCVGEVIDPVTGQAVPPGAEGELVITNPGRVGSSLIRYRTGDRVIQDALPCPCGRPWPRFVGGVLGRTDDLLFIRGNNVYPSMLEAVVRQFAEVAEYQIEVRAENGMHELELKLEPRQPSPNLAGDVAAAIRDAFHFRPRVILVPPGSLPRSEMKSQRLVRIA